MTHITFKNQPVNTVGQLPSINSEAPAFTVTKNDLSEISLRDFKNKKIVISIFPSVDTQVCANSVRKFNEKATQIEDVIVLCVSADLPFALNRFCAAEGLENVITSSSFRHPEFGKNYGVTIIDGPLAGLLSRAVIALDKNHHVIYSEQVPEITQEPNYEKVLAAIQSQ